MKSMLLLIAAMTFAGTAGALAQDDACSKKYSSCMDRCAGRPAAAQGTCMQTCQSQSNGCYEAKWGPATPRAGAVVQAADPATAKAGDADASAAKDSPKQPKQ